LLQDRARYRRLPATWAAHRIYGLFDAARHPALAAHAVQCEALPPFKEIVQPLAPPSWD
jgi:hypothetical protein